MRNHLGLSFLDLFCLYRSGGDSIWAAMRAAWHYRNWQPYHSGSDMLRAQQCEQLRLADERFGRMFSSRY